MKKLFILSISILISFASSAQTQVKFYTTLGNFTVELNDNLAPITSGNFKSLVQQKYYDGISFHRVINGFMIQGGNGATKPNIQDEFHASLSNVQGTISMANTGAANSGNTQFFINLIDNTNLDFDKAPLTSKHPVFGKVVRNFNVIQTIGNSPVSGSVPVPTILMDSVRVLTIPDPPQPPPTLVKFYTTLGDFMVELADSLAPITSGNFKSLVQDKYYDGVSFHRVIDNFMIQGGNGASKPRIPDEFHPALSNIQGTISMANSGPSSGTTQFFINLVNNTRLDYNKSPTTSKHPVFGHVVDSFSVVQKIGSAPVTGSVPTPAIYMDSVRIWVIPADTSDTTNNGNPGDTNKTNTSISNDFQNASFPLLKCYPNPITEHSIIEFTGNSNASIRLIDVIGNELGKAELQNEGSNTYQFNELFDVELESGIYFLESQADDQRQTIRLNVR